jgi:hypothetical protein
VVGRIGKWTEYPYEESRLVPQGFDLESEFMEMLKRSETLGYFWSLVGIVMEAHDRFYIRASWSREGLCLFLPWLERAFTTD